DLATLTITGFNDINASKYYTQSFEYPNINKSNYETIQSIPIVEHLPNDFFLFPFKLLHRIKKAIKILRYLLQYCPIYLYEIKNIHGYNPYELLKAMWKKLSERRMEVLGESNLITTAFSTRQKNIVLQTWTVITTLINTILSILHPDKSVMTSIYKNILHQEHIKSVSNVPNSEHLQGNQPKQDVHATPDVATPNTTTQDPKDKDNTGQTKLTTLNKNNKKESSISLKGKLD
ncbi:hypothetical protein HEP_00522400, partial [Hepatocystis sp. ex Piliocolobus tephrosceles]